MGGYWQDRRKVMKLALTAIEKMVEAGGGGIFRFLENT
jgi:hypothetical protein